MNGINLGSISVFVFRVFEKAAKDGWYDFEASECGFCKLTRKLETLRKKDKIRKMWIKAHKIIQRKRFPAFLGKLKRFVPYGRRPRQVWFVVVVTD